VTVALAGDAGDEVFLGYPRYRGVRLRQMLNAMPLPLRRALAWTGAQIPEHTNGFHARRRAREFLSTAAQPWQQAYAEWVSYFTPAMRGSLYSDEFRAAVGDYDSGEFLRGWFARAAGAEPLAQTSYVDLHTFLPHNLLEYGDRMSMAHSLELRLPFTDHHLVEFAMRLPSAMKLRGRTTKYLLREAVRKLLPEPVLTRNKLGLNPPLGIWLRRDLRGMVESYLSPEAVQRRGWFQPAAVERLVEDFRAGGRDFSLHLWALLVLEEWCRQHLDGRHATQPASQTVGARA
jgi:asparagine synthase (glutamine-hydrolysing)